MSLNGSYDKPAISYGTDNAKQVETRLYHRLKCHVTDQNGQKLIGAPVKIYDKDDNLLLDTVTDSDGNVEEDIQTATAVWDSAGGNYDSIYTTLNPLRVVISQAGYETYDENFTLEEKTDWTIALQDPEIGERTFEIIDISKEIEIIDVSTELEVIEL
ncbi:unnamed protein product [marine sediment metagenome]|uniref:Carboxypeptidase regulatory-like domain-containing protein n=1 Tax=marine sediment metagenome TaxID=412755 RepID=X1RIG9_9ZZZZ